MPKIPEDKRDLPTVKIGGERWAVAPMSARKIIRFGDLASGLDFKSPTGVTLTAIYECAWLAVSTIHKEDAGTFDEFLDRYHVPFDEALEAFPTLAKSAGMKFTKGEEKADPSREKTSSQDGTSS